MADKERPIPDMCLGCVRNKKTRCDVIKEPGYFFETYGICFAKVDATRAKEIEKEIDFYTKGKRFGA